MLSTDTFGFPFCIAGKSAHDEMDLMQASGLTPFQILQSATVNPAKFLGKENEFGTVTVGKRADLLLVNDNPLTDLQTTRKPDGVMLRGVWLPSEKLQQMLEEVPSRN
jgi:imidazolonepropionase-like amidohydrolase